MRVTLTISSVKVDQTSTLNSRIPFWSSLDGATATINGQKLDIPPPGNFLSITRQWVASDKLMLQLPIGLRVEMIQDDRPQYASIQAILFGPYVLAGLSSGDWDISVGSASSVSDWVKAVPREYSSQLVSLSQESGNGSLFFSNSNNFVTMDQLPKAGTDSAIHATFRLVHMNSGDRHLSFRMTNGRPVMLEPFDNPGWTVMHHGPKNSIAISTSSDAAASVFLMVDGLGGKPNTISLEAESNPNCFISSYANSTLGSNVQLVCLEDVPSSNDALFRKGSSFAVGGGLRSNDPISFIAEGLKRSFVLEPLLGLRDESYNVYFNITA